MATTEADVVEALRPVEDPELHRSIVELDMVREVRIDGTKVDVLIARGLGHHPGYRCDRVTEGSGLGDWLIAKAGKSEVRLIVLLMVWLVEGMDKGL